MVEPACKFGPDSGRLIRYDQPIHGPRPEQIEAALLHDLNNLLQVMMGNLELLKRARAGAGNRRCRARRDAGAGQLTDRLRRSRAAASPRAARCSTSTTCSASSCRYRAHVGDAIRVETEFAADLMSAFADRRALQVALLELTATRARRCRARAAASCAPRTRAGPGADRARRHGGGMPAPALVARLRAARAAEGGKLAASGCIS